MLILHLLCISGESIDDEDYMKRSAMKQVENERGMKALMDQIKATLDTVDAESQQKRDESSAVHQQEINTASPQISSGEGAFVVQGFLSS